MRARRADVDALRVLAILVVFGVHCAQVFSPWQDWHIQNDERSAWIGELTLLAWPWVMPIFMLLAGAGAWYSLARRSDGRFLRERTLRLAIPTVIGTFILIPPQIWIERLAQGRFSGSFLAFLPRFVDGFYPEGNLSAGHLWFLAYLYVYAVLTLPLLRWLRSDSGRRRVDRLASVLDGRWRIIVLPALAVSVTQVALRAPFPETLALVNDWANHALLLLSYLYGFVLMARGDLEERIQREWKWAVPVAVICSLWISREVWTSTEPDFLPRGYTLEYVAFWTAHAFAGWAWIVVLLGSAARWIRGRSALLTWAARRVFLFYVIHQTVIVLVAYPVVRGAEDVALKFGLVTALSLGATLIVVEAVERWAPGRARVFLGLRGPGR